MDTNSNNSFIPVVAQEKTLKVKEQKERFPGLAVLSLSEVKEGENRKLTLSNTAYSALGLESKDSRVGIARGYTDTAKTKEGLFLYKADSDSILFVQENKSAVKIDSAKFSNGNKRAMSVRFHNIISAAHSMPTDGAEKHFLLSTRYGDNYWLLTEYTPSTATAKTIPAVDSTDEKVSVGEEVEVTID